MDTNVTEPEPISDTVVLACDCRAPGGPDPIGEHMTMLMDLAAIGMSVVRTLGRKVDAAAGPTEADERIYQGFSRSIRRTLALRQKIHDGSKTTSAQRHAEALRRIDAQERARYQVRRAKIQRAVEGVIEAEVARRGMPDDREDLLSDMRERLLDVDIERAETAVDISAIVLGICKAIGIVPRHETWSDAAMADEVHRHYEALCVPQAESVEPAVPEPCGTGEEVTIDGTTFNADGSFKFKEFDPPESEWPADIVNRPPIDLLAMRSKPPDTG